MPKLQEIAAAIEGGKLRSIDAAVNAALEAGHTPQEILKIMHGAITRVGEKFQENEIFVSEMLVAALTMKKGVSVLRPQLHGEPQARLGKFILGTVEGDLHDIGKNLVGIMLESVGFEVIDLGVDVPASAFIQAILEHKDCKMVGISALLTTTLGAMERTVDAITTAGLRSQVKIFVGGAPVTDEIARRMGADVYTPDAASAARTARLMAM